jgi:hypothetical protein
MELELINLGRNKVNKKVTVKDGKGVLRELRQHIMSNEIELIDVDGKNNRYDVYVGGFRNVGQIFIKE